MLKGSWSTRSRDELEISPSNLHERVKLVGLGATLGVLLFVLWSCQDTAIPAQSVTVRDSAGITIVENDHTRPRWTTPWVLSPEPVLRIGSVEEDSTQLLYRVTDTRRLRDGRVLVVNSGSAEVRIYSAEGQLLQILGGPGEGPGEFRSPWNAYPLQGDSILVVDLYRELAVFDSDGVYAREFNLNLPNGPSRGESAAPVDQFGDGSLLFQGYTPQDPSWQGVRRSVIRMLRIPLDGTTAGSLGDYVDQTVHYGQPHREYAFGAWAKEAAADSTMWYGPGDRFELREVAVDGTVLKLVRLNRPARPVTEADRDRYRENYTKQMDIWNPGRGEQYWRRLADEALFPDWFPVHHHLETDPLGNVWVQDYQPRLSVTPEDRMWSVFDAEGAFLGEVVVPGGLTVHDIGEAHMTGKWTDDLGIEYVHLYEIEKPLG